MPLVISWGNCSLLNGFTEFHRGGDWEFRWLEIYFYLLNVPIRVEAHSRHAVNIDLPRDARFRWPLFIFFPLTSFTETVPICQVYHLKYVFLLNIKYLQKKNCKTRLILTSLLVQWAMTSTLTAPAWLSLSLCPGFLPHRGLQSWILCISSSSLFW